MRPRRGELAAQLQEPQPLGAETDPKSALLWEEFAAGGKRSIDEIYRLWVDPEVTNPTIRQRAVTILTAPNGYSLPYSHPDQSLGRFLGIDEEIDGERAQSLRKRLAKRPQLATEAAAGLLYWIETTGGQIDGAGIDSRPSYLAAMLELLPIVDEETGDKLFAHYPINDLESYWTLDSDSGYNPLTYLLRDSAVPRRYKNIGLARWFDIAEQEIQGIAQPRVEHEEAIRKMAEFAQTWTYGEDVDDEVHTAIIAFLEKNTPDGTTYVRPYTARQVEEHITDAGVRFNFAWRHVFIGPTDDWSHFKIEDVRDLDFVGWMRDEAQKRDLPQFEAKASSLFQEYAARRQERTVAEAAEQDLQARLRK